MSNGRFFAFWVLAFLGFPLGGLLAIEVVGSIGDLLSAALAGGAVGVAQWLTLRSRQPRAVLWPVTVAVAWPVGWLVTWSIGVDVERGYAVFGASGALVFAVLTGVAMVVLTHRSRPVAPAVGDLGLVQP